MLTTFLSTISIIFVPIGTISYHGECGKDWYGQYYVNQSKIELCVNDPLVKNHELGHTVWYEYMTQEQRNKYTRLYNKSKIKSKTSGGGVHEDFADAYAMTQMKLNTPSYAIRIAFIRRIINK